VDLSLVDASSVESNAIERVYTRVVSFGCFTVCERQFSSYLLCRTLASWIHWMWIAYCYSNLPKMEVAG